MENKVLIVITSYFPYGKYEVFMETEVAELSKYFTKIYILPGTKDAYKRNVPHNVEVIDLLNKPTSFKLTIPDYIFAARITVSELFDKHFFKKLKHLKLDYAFFLSKLKESKQLEKFILSNKLNDAIFYSVWAYNYASVLSILKHKNIIRTFFCRAHGFDVYHFRRPHRGYAQFINFNFKNVNHVVAASAATANYLKTHYRRYAYKYKVIHLSVYDRGLNPFSQDQRLTVLSVSNNHPVKRIPLIVKVLNNTTVPLTWIHIGAQTNELAELSKELRNDVNKIFMPRISQQELTQYYKQTPVHLFIHFSKSEGGVPLAIQEAVSFGIPVLATSVGGIPEIIHADNGILLPENFNINEAAKIIDNFVYHKLNTFESRLNIKADWKNNFCAETNFSKFAKLLLEEKDK
jgi:glycosyltransferase involved in cell wall biosynthesis